MYKVIQDQKGLEFRKSSRYLIFVTYAKDLMDDHKT